MWQWNIKLQKYLNNVPVSLKTRGGVLHKFTDIAITLRARDYKGFDNYGSNAVIEVSNERSNRN